MLVRSNFRKYTKKIVIGATVWVSVLAVCTAGARADGDVLLPAEPVAAEATVAEPTAPAAPAEALDNSMYEFMNGQSIQTISFRKDMPIKDALRMLSQMYQKNIVPSAKVDGVVTVSHLYDVTFEEALQAILGTHKYEVRDNFIKIYTNEEFMQDKSRFEYVTIPLYYINAAEASNLAIPLLSEYGQIGVTSPAQQHTNPGQGGDSLAIHDRLVVSDYPENIQKIREMLADVDVQPQQVLIEVTIMEAVLNEGFEFGVDWSTVLGNRPGYRVTDAGANAAGDLLLDHRSGIEQMGGVFSVGISIDDITAALVASESIVDKTVLANPKILALNKQAGKLIIGKQEGYLSITNANNDNTITQQVQFLESGTVLEFRPFIGRDGMIRMELRPEQSTGSFERDLPNKTTTEVITNVMVKDGHTIVLGGLFKEATSFGRTQVPLFGDIPFIGELFKRSGDTSRRTELIVLITPHIIKSPEDADGATRLEDVYRLAYNARKDLHGLSRTRIAEDRYSRAVAAYNTGDYDAALLELNCPYVMSPRNNLDAIRLRERIFHQTRSGQGDVLERLMLQNLEKEESGKWLRR